MTAITPDQVVIEQPSFLERFTRPLGLFFRGLSRNRAGMIGFIGLVIYAVWVLIGPIFVPFDNVVRLDELAAPLGSRDQLMVRQEDANTYTSLASLAGKTVGIVTKTGNAETIAGYANTFTVNSTAWASGNGINNALDKLESGQIDALVIFSEQIKDNVTGVSQYANLVVSDPTLGKPHLLGTDTQGRDIFSHIINGGTSLILTAVLAGLFSTVIAVILGSVAALVGGVVDTVLTALANFVLTIPAFPLLIVLAALIQLSNFVVLALLIAALAWPVLMRAVLAQVL